MLINVQKMLTSLGQLDPCLTLDESIYQMAKEIQWRVPFLQNLTVRLGGFHRIKIFMGVIGKRMKSSGISALLEASDIFGPNQVEGLLNFSYFSYICYEREAKSICGIQEIFTLVSFDLKTYFLLLRNPEFITLQSCH